MRQLDAKARVSSDSSVPSRLAHPVLPPQHSPISRLPTELFVEIIAYATLRPVDFTSVPTPRFKPARASALITALCVSRTWYKTISDAPQLWSTLRIDGSINTKNVHNKTKGWALKAIGRSRADDRRLHSNTRGIDTLVITAAQDFSPSAFSSIWTTLLELQAIPSLRRVVVSFVDGTRTAELATREAAMTTEFLSVLHAMCADQMDSIVICSGGRTFADFELPSIYYAFPNLRTFKVWGSTNATSVAGLRAPFLTRLNAPLSPADGDDDDNDTPPIPRAPTQARSLAVTGAVLVADTPCHLVDFPQLESIDFELLGASIVWELLSAPDLKQCHAVFYGESQIDTLPLPDIKKAWRILESLRLGGAKRMASRLLDHAASLNLAFPRLTTVDLSFATLTQSQLDIFDYSNAPSLSSLNLCATSCPCVHGTLSLPTLSALKVLNVAHTVWVTDDTIRSLTTATPALERLTALGNPSLTGRPLMELVRFRADPRPTQGDKQLPSLLRELKVEGCSRLEPPVVDWLRRHIKPGGFKFNFLDPLEKGKRRSRNE